MKAFKVTEVREIHTVSIINAESSTEAIMALRQDRTMRNSIQSTEQIHLVSEEVEENE